MKGYIQIYTGNGKGKTTAAFGLSVRALGAGKKVHIIQFVKNMIYSEVKAIKEFSDDIDIEQYGTGCFIRKEPSEADFEIAKKGFTRVKEIISKNEIDILILDEINIALYYKLVNLNELIELLKQKPENMEIVLTGRYAPRELIELADLVTEMKEVKHYYKKGVKARTGIER